MKKYDLMLKTYIFQNEELYDLTKEAEKQAFANAVAVRINNHILQSDLPLLEKVRLLRVCQTALSSHQLKVFLMEPINKVLAQLKEQQEEIQRLEGLIQAEQEKIDRLKTVIVSQAAVIKGLDSKSRKSSGAGGWQGGFWATILAVVLVVAGLSALAMPPLAALFFGLAAAAIPAAAITGFQMDKVKYKKIKDFRGACESKSRTESELVSAKSNLKRSKQELATKKEESFELIPSATNSATAKQSRNTGSPVSVMATSMFNAQQGGYSQQICDAGSAAVEWDGNFYPQFKQERP